MNTVPAKSPDATPAFPAPSVSAIWPVTIVPDRRGAIISIVMAWLFCAGVAALNDASGWVAWGPVAPFALIITWHGLKTAFLGAGTLIIDREGFSITRRSEAAQVFPWRDVESFHVARFGESAIFEGRLVPRFRIRGETEDRDLPQPGGYTAKRLVSMMMSYRDLAETNTVAPDVGIQDGY